MSASKHINPNQLKLFATAKELMHYSSLDAVDNEDDGDIGSSLITSPELTKRKLLESRTGNENMAEERVSDENNSLYNSIKRHGVMTPVLVQKTDEGDTWLLNGHHRVATAYDINPDMYIGLNYTDDMYDPDAWDATDVMVTPEMRAQNVRKPKKS